MKNPQLWVILWAILAALAVSTVSVAQTPQPTTRPTSQKVEGVAPVRKSTDLVVDAVSWAYNTPRGRSGASVIEEARPTGAVVVAGMEVGSTSPFRGVVNIPGSLAPGEKRTIEIPLEGKSRNAAARKRLQMKLDKFYTARVDIEAKGDDQLNNNGANLMFRLDARGQAVGPMFTPRATDPARGTVEVRAPGS